MKKFFVIGTFFIAILFAGCQQQTKDDPNALSAFSSPEGVKAEMFLPQNSFMIMKFGTDDAGQQASMAALAAHFPAETTNLLVDEIAKSFNEDFEQLGLTFADDFLPALGSDAQVLFGFFGDFQQSDEPDILGVLLFAQPAKFVEWMERSISEGQGQKQNYKSYSIYSSPENESYIALYKDFLVMGNRLQIVKEALDRAESGGLSLLSSASYQKALSKAPESLGFFFIDPRFTLEIMAADPDASQQLSNAETIRNFLEAIEGEFFAFVAEPEGIRIIGSIYGDPEKWKQIEDISNFHMDPSYLYRQLPGEGVLLYSEGFNFQKSAHSLMNLYGQMEGFEEGMESMKEALTGQGIDFENDVLGFMDKGYAFGMYDSRQLLPSLGIFIDASSNTAGAKKVMNQIYEGIGEGLATVPPEFGAALQHSRSLSDGSTNFLLTFDTDRLPEDQLTYVPEEVLSQKFELHYGINNNNLAFFAFFPDFEDGGYGTLAENQKFMEALDSIEGYDRGISYLNIEGLMAYVDRIVNFAMVLDGGSAEDLREYITVKNYVAPIKSMIMGSNGPGPGEVGLQGFIRIGE